jgi:hypothetical protein
MCSRDALDVEYPWTDIVPCAPSILPRYEPSHDFQTKRRHREEEVDLTWCKLVDLVKGASIIKSINKLAPSVLRKTFSVFVAHM